MIIEANDKRIKNRLCIESDILALFLGQRATSTEYRLQRAAMRTRRTGNRADIEQSEGMLANMTGHS